MFRTRRHISFVYCAIAYLTNASSRAQSERPGLCRRSTKWQTWRGEDEEDVDKIAFYPFRNNNKYCGANQMLVQCDLIGATSGVWQQSPSLAKELWSESWWGMLWCWLMYLLDRERVCSVRMRTNGKLVAEAVLVGELTILSSTLKKE